MCVLQVMAAISYPHPHTCMILIMLQQDLNTLWEPVIKGPWQIIVSIQFSLEPLWWRLGRYTVLTVCSVCMLIMRLECLYAHYYTTCYTSWALFDSLVQYVTPICIIQMQELSHSHYCYHSLDVQMMFNSIVVYIDKMLITYQAAELQIMVILLMSNC